MVINKVTRTGYTHVDVARKGKAANARQSALGPSNGQYPSPRIAPLTEGSSCCTGYGLSEDTDTDTDGCFFLVDDAGSDGSH
jgi:hypothetical protein